MCFLNYNLEEREVYFTQRWKLHNGQSMLHHVGHTSLAQSTQIKIHYYQTEYFFFTTIFWVQEGYKILDFCLIFCFVLVVLQTRLLF